MTAKELAPIESMAVAHHKEVLQCSDCDDILTTCYNCGEEFGDGDDVSCYEDNNSSRHYCADCRFSDDFPQTQKED